MNETTRAQINIRINPKAKALLDRGAELAGEDGTSTWLRKLGLAEAQRLMGECPCCGASRTSKARRLAAFRK